MDGKLTATMMAGFVAILAGTEMYIWRLVGLLPKPVTCWRAPKAELAKARRPKDVVNVFMLVVKVDFLIL